MEVPQKNPKLSMSSSEYKASFADAVVINHYKPIFCRPRFELLLAECYVGMAYVKGFTDIYILMSNV